MNKRPKILKLKIVIKYKTTLLSQCNPDSESILRLLCRLSLVKNGLISYLSVTLPIHVLLCPCEDPIIALHGAFVISTSCSAFLAPFGSLLCYPLTQK